VLFEPPRVDEVEALFREAYAWLRARAPAQPDRRKLMRLADHVRGTRTDQTWLVPNYESDAYPLRDTVHGICEQDRFAEDPGDPAVLDRCLDGVLQMQGVFQQRPVGPKSRRRCAEQLELAGAWARHRAGEEMDGEDIEMKPVAYAAVLAVLAATGVVAYLVWRSGREREHIRSKDYQRVAALRGHGGAADEGVTILLDDAARDDRALWTLEAALTRLDGEVCRGEAVRTALQGLCTQDEPIVAKVDVNAGDAFDEQRMEDVSGVRWDEIKVVEAVEGAGFVATGSDNVVVPVRVRCSTEDWRALNSGNGQVGRWVREHLGELVSDSEELCHGWRAEDGLRRASRLHEVFDEDQAALAAWRDDLHRRLDEAYQPSSSHAAPILGPQVGDLYQQAQMRLEDGAVSERSVVTEVVFPGLYTPSGYAIVEAVVRVKPAGEGEQQV
jgi:hypothetical protein